MNADLVNGLFQLGAALFIFNHCRVLYRDKLVRGVSIFSTIFFLVWGFWNLWYFPFLEQVISTIAAVAVTIANILYTYMMAHYLRKEKNEQVQT